MPCRRSKQSQQRHTSFFAADRQANAPKVHLRGVLSVARVHLCTCTHCPPHLTRPFWAGNPGLQPVPGVLCAAHSPKRRHYSTSNSPKRFVLELFGEVLNARRLARADPIPFANRAIPNCTRHGMQAAQYATGDKLSKTRMPHSLDRCDSHGTRNVLRW